MKAAWYWFSQTLARRWRGYVGLAILLGLFGGVALASVSGSRRTASAFHRFLIAGHPSDMAIDTGPYSLEHIAALSAFPQVKSTSTYVAFNVAVMNTDGTPNLGALSSVEWVGSVDGLYFKQDRFIVTSGHQANPAIPGDVVVSEYAANTYHLRVGQHLDVGVYTNAQINDPAIGTNAIVPKDRRIVTIRGIGVFSDEIVQDDADRGPRVLLTPAFTSLNLGAANYAWSGLLLRRGAADVDAVKRHYVALLPPGFPHFFHVTALTEAQAQRSIRPQAVALGAFGLLVTLAMLVLVGQALFRQLGTERADLVVLRALGAGPEVTSTAGLFGCVAAMVVGAGLAAALAIGLSPLAPIGPVRRVEVHPGVSFDGAVLGFGAVIFVMMLATLSVVLAYRQAPHRVDRRGGVAVGRPSRSVEAARRAGLPVTAVAGLHLALERGWGRTAVSVRSVMAAAVAAVLAVTAALTFASSLRQLVNQPRLYGWDWNQALVANSGYGSVNAPKARDLLNHDGQVEAWTGVYFGSLQLDGLDVSALGAEVRASMTPPILSGHAPRAQGEIVLGPATLAQLRKKVGDTVALGQGTGTIPMKIVGTATFPSIGIAHGTHTSLGIGALLPFNLVPGIHRNHGGQLGSDRGANALFVRFRPGVDTAAASRHLRAIADRIGSASSGVESLPVQRPAEIVNARNMGQAPVLLAGSLVGAALLSLGLALTASVRRRQRDLAMLKGFGFTQRQLATAIAWQSTATVTVGIALGVPGGIALGRWLWVLFARQLYVVPDPSMPFVLIGAMVVGVLVASNLIAAILALMAARTSTAALLRSE